LSLFTLLFPLLFVGGASDVFRADRGVVPVPLLSVPDESSPSLFFKGGTRVFFVLDIQQDFVSLKIIGRKHFKNISKHE
jgi:hypothetical protein